MNDILILCHGDCDGMTAGAIALVANPGARIWLTNPVRLDNVLKQIKEKYKLIIIADIALNERDYDQTFQEIKRLTEMGTKIVYIDHHPFPEGISKKDIPATKIVHKEGSCAAELTYLHFENKLSWKHKFLAAIGAVGDYETESKFAQEVMRDYDNRSISFQAAIIVQALGEIPEYDDNKMKKSLIERLALGVLPSELNNLVERALRGSIVERNVREYVHKNAKKMKNIGYIKDIPTGGGFIGKGALFAATATDMLVGVCGNSIRKKISMSIRRRDDRINLNIATRKAAKEVGGSGGGHASASGATIEKSKWKKFLEFLDYEVQKQT